MHFILFLHFQSIFPTLLQGFVFRTHTYNYNLPRILLNLQGPVYFTNLQVPGSVGNEVWPYPSTRCRPHLEKFFQAPQKYFEPPQKYFEPPQKYFEVSPTPLTVSSPIQGDHFKEHLGPFRKSFFIIVQLLRKIIFLINCRHILT